MDKITKIVLTFILIIAVITGGYLGWQRHIIENENRTVELVLDYDDLRLLSSLSKVPFNKLLDDLKLYGVTSIGVREETPSQAAILGELQFLKGSGAARYYPELQKRKLLKPERTYFFSSNPTVQKRVSQQLLNSLDRDNFSYIGSNIIEVKADPIELQEVGLGFSEKIVNYLGRKGFLIVPRLTNDPRFFVLSKLNVLKGFKTVLFEGEEVVGYPNNLNETSAALKDLGVRYGNIEIVKQDGDHSLKKLMGINLVRVHSVPEDELKKLNKDEALDRFARAVKERGIRMIYVRPFLPPQIAEDPIQYNLAYLQEIIARIKGAGFLIGEASAPRSTAPASWQIYVLGLGVLAGGILLLNLFTPVSWWKTLLYLFLGTAGMAYLGAGEPSFLLEKGLVFLAAVIFPTYAILLNFSQDPPELANPWLFSLFLIFKVAAVTLVGIFLIVGLTSYTSFMLTAEIIPGIRLALVLPVFLVGAFFLFRLGKPVKEMALQVFEYQVKIWQVLAGLVFLGIIFIFLARSGNFTLPVPGIEKAFRELLEKVLVVRPRTKEFLFGYPLLYAAAFYLLKGKKSWLWILLALGAVAPISLLNAFCHVHTPLVVSMVRSFNGLVLGSFVGLLVIWILNRR